MAHAECQGKHARRRVVTGRLFHKCRHDWLNENIWRGTWGRPWGPSTRLLLKDPPPSFDPQPPSLFPAEWLLIEEGVGCVSAANNEVINRTWATTTHPARGIITTAPLFIVLLFASFIKLCCFRSRPSSVYLNLTWTESVWLLNPNIFIFVLNSYVLLLQFVLFYSGGSVLDKPLYGPWTKISGHNPV